VKLLKIKVIAAIDAITTGRLNLMRFPDQKFRAYDDR